MVTRFSKNYESLTGLENEVAELESEEFTKTVYGQGITVKTICGEEDVYSLEETFSELNDSLHTKYRATITYDQEPQISLKAMIGPLPTVEFKGKLKEFSNFKQVEDFLANSEGWR
jgi:hypothetical protein